MAIVYYDPDSGAPMYDDGQGGYTPVEPSRYRNQGNQVVYGYEPTNDGQNPLYGDPYGPEVTEYLNRLGGPRALSQAGFTEEEFRKDPWNVGGKVWNKLSGEGGGMSLLESLKTAATSDVAKLVGMGFGVGNIGNLINSGGLGNLFNAGANQLTNAAMTAGKTLLQGGSLGNAATNAAGNLLGSGAGNILSTLGAGAGAVASGSGMGEDGELDNNDYRGGGDDNPFYSDDSIVDWDQDSNEEAQQVYSGDDTTDIGGGDAGDYRGGGSGVTTTGGNSANFQKFLKDVLGIHTSSSELPRSVLDLLGGVYSAYSQNKTAGNYEDFTKSYLDRAFPQATTDEQIGWAGVSKDMRTNGDFWKNNSLMNQIGQTAANKAERQAAAQGYNLSSNALQSMYRDSYDAMASKFALPYMEQVSRNAGLQKASPDAFANSMASNIYKNDQQTQGTIGNVIKTGVNTVLGKP